MTLRWIADVNVTVPVPFGNEASVEHRLLLRFGPLELDGSVRGHVLGEGGGTLVVARDAIVWDPVLRGFATGDHAALERLAERLDPMSAVLGVAGRGVLEIVRLVSAVLSSTLSPNVVLVGGVGTLLLEGVRPLLALVPGPHLGRLLGDPARPARRGRDARRPGRPPE